MSGFQHLIVPQKDFQLISGQDVLTEYRFNSGIARHLFCATCGIKPFYIPRSNPDGFSLNLRCLQIPDGFEFEIKEFDGQNWRKNAEGLKHLTEISPSQS